MTDAITPDPGGSLRSESPPGDSETPDLRDTATMAPDDRGCPDDGFTLRDEPSRSLIAIRRDFGKYELINELGRGGMGVVYKARQKDLDRVVALKMILSSHLASRDQVARFYAEARAAARMRDPNIVGIYEVGEHGGQHFFTMEYVAGKSLAQVIRGVPMGIEEASRLVMIVARAVDSLHKQGMIHRDLKPSNILLDEAGNPSVSDFGLAKLLESEERVTASNAIVGTPGYMAPEQAAGRGGQVGPASDLYSLGAILFECLTGRPPYDGSAPLETLVRVLEGEPPQPRQLNPTIPRPLEKICLKCLEKDPGDRYASARDLADDLDHFLRGEPVEATRGGPWHRLRRWARREPALASRLGTMAACGIIIYLNHSLIAYTQSASLRSFVVVVNWAMASFLCQHLLQRPRWADLGRYVWSATDVVLFSLLVYVNQGLNTAMVSGYFLIVSASGLWFRERMVWLTTLLSVAGYAALAIGQGLPEGYDSPYRHFVFASALAASGFVVSYQVRRVRALSCYYDPRPLP
ncbi:serine/threonine-protein kinase [Tautonia plasticadhaerens]|uniref:non-specific serine/threonine protein kinase n=1 Tax=Tautonia plasticadhaerens TaxID=2527974 RepID=A0A518GZQ4_9BACT|nr:serine/threonine-protein kinase [Tautonia plasticadhaerens]QDV34063.1 Serine/threonine-protein kinase PrkC [Tautonia plasticadhaerens]